MSTAGSEELGHGVVARPEGAASWTVTSRWLELGWQARQGSLAGTAVRWHDGLFEVVAREQDDSCLRWRLVPWPEDEVARVVSGLDRARVAAVAANSADDERRRKTHRGLVLALPLTGLLPKAVQLRLEREYGFPACRASQVSAAVEIGLGAYGIIRVVAAVVDRSPLPQALVWLLPLAPLLFAEGLVRFTVTLARGEPIGSLSTWPVTWFARRPSLSDRPSPYRPELVRFEPDSGVLELATVRTRPDWLEDGVLRYRGRAYRLVDRLPVKGRMVYRFEVVTDDEQTTLQLLPPQVVEPPKGSDPSLGVLALTVRIVLLSFAPRPLQEQWFRARGDSPLAATILCALAEAFGGLANLLGRPGSGALHLVDLFFLVEGGYRLVTSVARRHAVGSLLGLPFLPLYRRWVEEEERR